MKKLKILFGFYDHQTGMLCKKYPDDYKIIEKDYKIIERRKKGDSRFINYPNFNYSGKLKKIDRNLDKFINEVAWDQQTLMLYDRDFFGKKLETLTIRSIKITNFILSSFVLLQKLSPKFIIFHNMPHQFKSWVFAIVAEKLGSKIVYPEFTIIPWRYYLVRGIKKPGILMKKKNKYLKKNSFGLEDSEAIKSLFRIRVLNSKKSIPRYANKNYRDYSPKLFKDLIKYWKRPDLIVNKYICYNQYKKLQFNEIPTQKDVVFFLHYQPELSTLPRGYFFAQQYLAINLLSHSMPYGATLYVREHPSTFANLCTWKERTKKFYKSIANLANVRILSLDTPSYELINNCGTVATISGTPAIEALTRGKKAIVFAPVGPYMGIYHQNLHKYKNLQNLKFFLKKKNIKLKSQFKINFRNFNKVTMSGIEKKFKDFANVNQVSLKWRDRSRKKWIDYLLNI